MGSGATVESGALVQDWFSVTNPEPGNFTIEEPLHDEQVKSTLIVGRERALLIDSGMGIADIRALVESLTDRPITVVNCHAHWDHIGGNHLFADGTSEIWIHEAEAADVEAGVSNECLRQAFDARFLRGPLPPGVDRTALAIPPTRATHRLYGGEHFDLGDRVLEVIHAPGHSPGGIVLLDRANGVLFSTDVAYPCALYAFGPQADLAAYRRTMAQLADLAASLRVVYPSHGSSPMSPTRLPAMRDALDALATGRPPDEVNGNRAIHRFDSFSVLTPVDGPPRRGGEG